VRLSIEDAAPVTPADDGSSPARMPAATPNGAGPTGPHTVTFVRRNTYSARRGARVRAHSRPSRVSVPVLTALFVIVTVSAAAGVRFLPHLLASPAHTAPTSATPTVGDTPSPTATTPSPSPTPSPTPSVALFPFKPGTVTAATVHTTGFFSWALLDRRTGTMYGSSNITDTSTTASMVKAWLVADYLRLVDDDGETPSQSRLDDLASVIRDSDNDAAERTYSAIGRTNSINRMISICKLTDTTAVPDYWSNTIISARDSVRMGACIADGRAAGKTWTPWVLDMMRQVRGEGDFGIRDAFPTDQRARVAIKNGWLLRDEDDRWHTSCLAIGDTWVMAVLQRYPSSGDYNGDFAHTEQVCADTARQLLDPALYPRP
jgi:hypothetical protein